MESETTFCVENWVTQVNLKKTRCGGLRTLGFSKHSYEKKDQDWFVCRNSSVSIQKIDLPIVYSGSHLPLITVVTVVFNAARFLEETITSVISQTYPNMEYIIIDGGSIDGTVDIIRKYERQIDFWLSDKDNGIYDAMNKGIRLSRGRWINFMNAGDCFHENETIKNIFKSEYNADVIYGNVAIKYRNYSRTQISGSPNNLWKGMQFSHQSSFVNLLNHCFQFNSDNKIAADLEFFYGAYKIGAKFEKYNDIISIVAAGGLSDSNRIQTILSSQRAVLNCGASNLVRLQFFMYLVSSIFRDAVKRILPAYLVDRIIRAKK
jgi:glycosyltransferase involved in cell wall biosynthesis